MLRSILIGAAVVGAVLLSFIAMGLVISLALDIAIPDRAHLLETETVVEEVEVTVVEEVEVTPDACLEAIAITRRIALVNAEFANTVADVMGISGEAVMAAISWDADELDRLTAQINAHTADIEDQVDRLEDLSDDFELAAAVCEEA